MTKISKYFSDTEMACRCCGRMICDAGLLDMLDRAREIAKVPFVITSGYRCEKHNKEVGGASNSAHLEGKAVDIHAVGSGMRYRVLDALLKAGFSRIGISKMFIHADIATGNSHPSGCVWLYGGD